MSASVAAHAHAQPHRSTFTPSDKLEDQAASAALYVHRDTPTTKRSSSSVLDQDGRLSSASAALSLKYARAQDLPSFPSTGGVKLAAAGAAASLAESNKKTIELWTPGDIPHANTAAEKARDYKMEPLWKPELSRAGSQAAIAAHRDAAPVDIWRAPSTEHGQSAASSALQNPRSPPAITERNVSGDGRQKALLAATASLNGGRRRAESAPTRPVPPSPHAGWALKAATSSHNVKPPNSPTPPSTGEMSSADAARVQNMAKNNISRQMYTSNPPVAIEVEERRRQDMLRASAVAMARKMFAIQQVQIDEARGIHRSQSHYAAHTARRRAQSDAANNPKIEEVPQYENLEQAARRLAQDRLSKLHDEHAEYRQYYGTNTTPQRSRTFLRRGRRRSDNIPEDDDSDVEESRKIRQQMSLFQGKLAEIDSKKRQADRDALLAAAHKNVTARMNAMDEKVFSETGKTSTQQRELWERQARERAQRESDDRLINVGKVHIGGGKYLEQEEIDAIAKARLQPTLDEITKKAEEQRAKDEEIRLEQERVKAEQEAEKKRQAEIKAEQKAVVDREKAEQKAQRTEERRIQQEQKHEERRTRTEQKTAEKKARDDADAAEKERRRTERGTDSGKSRFGLPGFLSRGGVAAGATAAGATVAVAEGTADAVEGGAGALTGGTAVPATATGEADEPTGETVHDQVTMEPFHDQVTMDPAEAEHAVAAADDEEIPEPDVTQPADAEDDQQPELSPPADIPLPEDEEVEPKDTIGAVPYSSTNEPQETTIPTSPISPASPASPASPTSPSKRNSRVKSFFKKFRTGSKAQNDFNPDQPASAVVESNEQTKDAFAPSEPAREDPAATDSIRDVALAGRSDNETEDMYGGSAKPNARVSPMDDEAAPGLATGGPGIADEDHKERDISPASGTSSLSEEPYVIAADVASSRYSNEQPGSKRDSGMDQLATLSDEDDEPRGRKGFRERFLKKVIPGRDKDKKQPGTFGSSTVGNRPSTSGTAAAAAASAPTTKQADVQEPETAPQAEPGSSNLISDATHTHDDPEETDLPREKVQEPSTTSTEATGNTTVTGTTTPALTHTQTNGDDDEDFEEARDTFDEGRLVSASKVDSGAAKIVDVSSPMTPAGGAKGRTSGEGSRFTEEL